MEKLKRNQIKKACKVFAQIFADYEAYDILFGNDKRRMLRRYYLYRLEVYMAKDFTYVDDDFGALCSIKRPTKIQQDGDGKKIIVSDREYSAKPLFYNPFFAIAFFAAVGIKQFRIAVEYVNMADETAKNLYNPNTDYYVKNIGVVKSARGQGRLKRMLNDICGDNPIYLETHDINNVAIYQKLGFELLETVEWRGITHYAMRREGKAQH